VEKRNRVTRNRVGSIRASAVRCDPAHACGTAGADEQGGLFAVTDASTRHRGCIEERTHNHNLAGLLGPQPREWDFC